VVSDQWSVTAKAVVREQWLEKDKIFLGNEGIIGGFGMNTNEQSMFFAQG